MKLFTIFFKPLFYFHYLLQTELVKIHYLMYLKYKISLETEKDVYFK